MLLLLIEEIAESTRGSAIGVGAKATVAIRLAEAYAWLTAPNQTRAGRFATGHPLSKDGAGG
jgi:hypothetical protein